MVRACGAAFPFAWLEHERLGLLCLSQIKSVGDKCQLNRWVLGDYLQAAQRVRRKPNKKGFGKASPRFTSKQSWSKAINTSLVWAYRGCGAAEGGNVGKSETRHDGVIGYKLARGNGFRFDMIDCRASTEVPGGIRYESASENRHTV